MESFRQHGMMKQRVRLGLADPAVAGRFMLWGAMAFFASRGTMRKTAAS